MSRNPGKPILPWPVLALGVVAAGVALIVAFVVVGGSSDGGDGGGTATPRPTPTLGTVSGTIGYITPDGNFALMDGNGANQRVLTSDGAVTAFAWSPDGSIAAVEFGGSAAAHVAGVNPADGSVLFDIAGAAQPLWSPDGDRLVVVLDGSLGVFDTSGAPARVFESGMLPTWSPDGASVAFLKVDAAGKAVPVIGDVASGEESPLADGLEPADPVFPIAWHPSGDVLGYRNRLYDQQTGNTTDLPGTVVYWSPNGRMLLVAGDFIPSDNATKGLVLDATQEFKQTIGLSIRPSAEDIPAQLFIQKWTDWTSDGRYLLYMDPEPDRQRIRVYDTKDLTQTPHRNIAGERPDISPDGRYLTFMYQGKVWVYPLDASALAAVAEGGFPAWQPTP